MGDHEAADGGQLGKGVRPDVREEATSKLAQHVVARVMAERHQERAKQNLVARTLRQAGRQTLRRVHEHVAAPASPKGALQAGERGLALRPPMPGKGHDATGARGQGLVERSGHGRAVPLARKQGRREAKPLKAERGTTHRRCGRALQATVRHVRRDHEGAPHARGPQLGERLGQRWPNGPAARAGAQHRVGAHGRRKLIHEHGHTRVVLLTREAAGYDQGVKA